MAISVVHVGIMKTAVASEGAHINTNDNCYQLFFIVWSIFVFYLFYNFILLSISLCRYKLKREAQSLPKCW